KMAAVDQRGVCRDQLNRRDKQMIALAQRVARSPFVARQFARRLVRVHASLLAEPESAQRRIERAFAQPLAQAREKVVAGIGQGLRQPEWKVANRVRADDLEIVPRVALPASMAEFAVDQSGAQRGQCGEWFDRGAGREGALKSEARIDHGA